MKGGYVRRYLRQAYRGAPGRGRPRSTRSDYAIREAALELISELGYSGLSMDTLAEHAGVSKATIYRRWPSKEDAFAALLSELVRDLTVPVIGSTREEIYAAVELIEDFYRKNPAGRAIVALVSEIAQHPRLAAVVRSRFVMPWREALRSVLERGVERGDLRPDLDPDVTCDLLFGPIVYRTLFVGGTMSRQYVQRVAEEAYRALARVPEAYKGAS